MMRLVRLAVSFVGYMAAFVATYLVARVDGPIGWFGGAPMCAWMLLEWRLHDRQRERERDLAYYARREAEERAAAERRMVKVPFLPGSRARRTLLGFVPVLVQPGQTANVQAMPLRLFKPEALFIPPAVADDFNVVDILVGQDPVFVLGSVPAAAFSELCDPPELDFPTITPGTVVTIRVTNTTCNPTLFQARMSGRTVDHV